MQSSMFCITMHGSFVTDMPRRVGSSFPAKTVLQLLLHLCPWEGLVVDQLYQAILPTSWTFLTWLMENPLLENSVCSQWVFRPPGSFCNHPGSWRCWSNDHCASLSIRDSAWEFCQVMPNPMGNRIAFPTSRPCCCETH